MNRAVRRAVGLGLFLLVLVLGSSRAYAEVRSVSISDPADATPTVSGKPNNPDLSGVTIVYDNSAGTLRVTQTFYNAFGSLDTSANYAFFTDVSLLPASSEWRVNGATEEEQCGYENGLYGTITDYSYNGSKYRNAYSVGGFSGEAPVMTTIENGGTQVTTTASGPALVGHDWRCIRITLKANARSTATNLYSSWDGGCECWAVNVNLDEVGVTPPGLLYPGSSVIWFPGFPITRPKPESAEEKKAREEREKQAREKAKKERQRQAAREKKEMTLSSSAAVNDLRLGLKRQFGKIFRKASPVILGCYQKITYSRRRCSVYFEGGPSFHASHPANWFDHRLTFKGNAHVWLRRRHGSIYWFYSWKLRRIDERCALARSRKACTKTLVLK